MNDTIVALATPPGKGGIAVIRLSGPKATPISIKLHNRAEAAAKTPRQLVLGRAQFDGVSIDQALVAVMPAPNSYTGEDVVELQFHGSSAVAEKLIAGAIQSGARLAEPGEFTKRAYLNGKLDLMQAEAVADLIEADTEAALALAERKASGAVSKQIEQGRSNIVALVAQLSANLDFGEEDIPDIDSSAVKADIQKLQNQISTWLEQAKTATIAKEGLKVAIIGLPNAGKSSLLNALVGYERAIVTELAGTTRDTLEERISINGLGVVFVDTAGLRLTDEVVEKQGVKRSQDQSRQADVILVAASADQNMDQLRVQVKDLNLVSSVPMLAVQTKIDTVADAAPLATPDSLPTSHLTPHNSQRNVEWPFNSAAIVRTSAKTGQGLNELRQELYRVGVGSVKAESAFITSARQLGCLRDCLSELDLALKAAEDGAPLDIVAGELTMAAEQLGGLLGRSVSKAVIDEIFSNFCIGK